MDRVDPVDCVRSYRYFYALFLLKAKKVITCTSCGIALYGARYHKRKKLGSDALRAPSEPLPLPLPLRSICNHILYRTALITKYVLISISFNTFLAVFLHFKNPNKKRSIIKTGKVLETVDSTAFRMNV